MTPDQLAAIRARLDAPRPRRGASLTAGGLLQIAASPLRTQAISSQKIRNRWPTPS